MATGGLAPHFQIELYKAGRMDGMRVFVEADAGATDELSKKAAARMLTKHIKDMVGVSTEVIVGEPGSVERSRVRQSASSTTAIRNKFWPARSQKTMIRSVLRS